LRQNFGSRETQRVLAICALGNKTLWQPETFSFNDEKIYDFADCQALSTFLHFFYSLLSKRIFTVRRLTDGLVRRLTDGHIPRWNILVYKWSCGWLPKSLSKPRGF